MINKSILEKNFILILVFILFLFLHFFQILRPVENVVLTFANNIKVKLYSSGVFLESYFKEEEDVDLKKELKILQIDNIKLLAENAKMHNLQAENDDLRKLLDFTENKEYSYIIANVVSKNLLLNVHEQNNNLIINKGLQDGVEEGLAVINSEGVVVGKILEVKEMSSLLVLTSNNECRYAAMIQNGSGVSGIMEGRLGLTMSINFIPQTESIKSGDFVVTSGLEQKIPAGLLLGTVVEVKKESNEIWQSAVVDPIVNLDNLKIVSILKK